MKSSKMNEADRKARRARIMAKRERNHRENGTTWMSKGRWSNELKMFVGTALGTCSENSRRKNGWATLAY